MSVLNTFWNNWCFFWFGSKSEDDLKKLSIFRILFYSVILFFYISRQADVLFFFSENGILPSSYMKGLDIFKYHPSILPLLSDGMIIFLHIIFLILLFFCIIGFFTKSSTILVYFLHMMFINRNMGVMFGVDMISTFFLLYLCFAQTNAYYSIDKKISKVRKDHNSISHIAYRLMQIQLCVVYAYSGLEKLKGTRWWDGSAVWDVLTIGNMQRWDLSFVSSFPMLLAVSVYIVLLWEIYFPVLIWISKWRLPMLIFGVFMHLGIWLFMNLPTFGFMMISYYVLFLEKTEIEFFIKKINKLKKTLAIIKT
ncbi:MAG: HTTM domain-containing protein [Oligoflexia bacterium]|nr:HTTM domain-containing protein [Oligoflexia bacterium]